MLLKLWDLWSDFYEYLHGVENDNFLCDQYFRRCFIQII